MLGHNQGNNSREGYTWLGNEVENDNTALKRKNKWPKIFEFSLNVSLNSLNSVTKIIMF